MTTQVQLRRGSTAQISTFTGAPAEVIVDTTTWGLVVMDGITTGGHPITGGTATQDADYGTIVSGVSQSSDYGTVVNMNTSASTDYNQ